MVLLIDNYDSFTYILRDYLLQANQEVYTIKNDEVTLEYLKAKTFSSIVISPGPNSPSMSGITMDVINHFHETTPILGVCLGAQAIGEFFGMNLIKASKPMHGLTSTIHIKHHPIFELLPEKFQVMRYHSLILQNKKTTFLNIIAETELQEVMAIAHKHLPIVGLQFHPESVMTENGLMMIKNWFKNISAL